MGLGCREWSTLRVTLQHQFGVGHRFRHPACQQGGRVNGRDMHPSGLLAGTYDDLLPVSEPFCQSFCGDREIDPRAKEGRDGADAKFSGFLNGPIETITLTQTQSEVGLK